MQKTNGKQQKKKNELTVSMNTAQVVATRVCNNPSRGVAFTRPKPTDLFLSIVTKMAFEKVMG